MDANNALQVPQRAAGVQVPQSNTDAQIESPGGLPVPGTGTAGSGMKAPMAGTAGLKVPAGLRVPAKSGGGLLVSFEFL